VGDTRLILEIKGLIRSIKGFPTDICKVALPSLSIHRKGGTGVPRCSAQRVHFERDTLGIRYAGIELNHLVRELDMDRLVRITAQRRNAERNRRQHVHRVIVSIMMLLLESAALPQDWSNHRSRAWSRHSSDATVTPGCGGCLKDLSW
jgi:hypothetical protein